MPITGIKNHHSNAYGIFAEDITEAHSVLEIFGEN